MHNNVLQDVLSLYYDGYLEQGTKHYNLIFSLFSNLKIIYRVLITNASYHKNLQIKT